MAKEESFFNKIGNFLREVRIELQKVNWPSISEVVSYTSVVIAVVLMIALFIGGVDMLFSRIIIPIILN